MGRPADLRRGREHRADGGRHPRGAAGRDAARRRRRLARRHRTSWPTRWPPATRGSGSGIAPSSRASAAPISMASALALAGGATTIVQMDADFSHDPGALPGARRPGRRRARPTSSSARATRTGGGVVDWGLGRRVVSRGGSIFARVVLGLGQNDLTGGFKAWRAPTLAAVPFDGVHAGGYVFQIEMTFRADRARGAHPRDPDHLPRPSGRPVEDEPPDRRRGARRRRPAARRGAAAAGCGVGADPDRS